MVDDKFKDKRSDNVGRDKSNREKRIENLPPRLRDKEREKMEHHEKSKDKHRHDKDDHDKDVYQGLCCLRVRLFVWVSTLS